MPDLFSLLPGLAQVSHSLLSDRRIIAVGVSAVLYDERGFVFEVTRPRHWGLDDEGRRIVGIGGIGGRIRSGEDALECLRREVREEIGVGFWLEPAPSTVLIHDGALAAWLDVPRGATRPIPYIVNLLPSQLERPDRPDHLAIVSFRGILHQKPRRKDLFGVLMIERQALKPFFERREWSLADALVLPGLSFDLTRALPTGCVLRPTLTARAFQVLVQQSGSTLPGTSQRISA